MTIWLRIKKFFTIDEEKADRRAEFLGAYYRYKGRVWGLRYYRDDN